MITVFANRPTVGYNSQSFNTTGETIVIFNRTSILPFIHLMKGKKIIWACRWSQTLKRYAGYDDEQYTQVIMPLKPTVWLIDHRDPPSRGNRICENGVVIDDLSWLPQELCTLPCGCSTGFIVAKHLRQKFPNEKVNLVGFQEVQPGSENIHSMDREHQILHEDAGISFSQPQLVANQHTNSFNSRFPFRCVACYTPYQDRWQRLKNELNRVGITATPFWQIPNPYDEVLMRNLRLTKITAKLGHFSCSYNHYRMAKTALTLGTTGYLGFEDDVVFLKDATKFHEIITQLPQDADVALFEWRSNSKHAKSNNESLAKDDLLWHRADDMHLVGCGMYYLSPRGLAWYVRCMERAANSSAEKFRASDAHFRPEAYNGEVIPYCARLRPALQKSFDNCNSGSASHVYDEYSFASPPDLNLYP